MHAVMPERLQPRHEGVARHVEVLVDGLQAFGRYRFDADERAANLRSAHGLQEVGIFGRLHRDLRIEHEVVGQLLELRHQLEALGTNRLQILEMGLVGPPARRREIGQRHGIEVVVGEEDEAESAAPEGNDFAHHVVDATLSRFLSVGAPHRTERAVLRAAADRLHRSPHVLVGGQQIPARRDERAAFDAPAVVERLQGALGVIGQDASTRPSRRRPSPPRARRHARAPRRDRASGESRRTPPWHRARARAGRGDTRAARWRCECQCPRRHPARYSPGRKELQRFIDDHRRPVLRRRRRREHIQPARRDHGRAKGNVRRVDDVYAH